MEITIRNRQRLIPIDPRRVGTLTRKALSQLIRKENSRRPGSRGAPALPAPPLDPASVELGILFVNDRAMRRMNRDYRGIDRTTDVLSFSQLEGVAPGEGSPSLLLGDIVISLPQARRQAEAYGTTFYDELARLIIHGILHLVGYDHEKGGPEAARMRRKERELAEALCR